MISFGPAALIGLCIGFMWGIGCSLAIIYSIYLGGYRKGVEESLAVQKPKRYLDVVKRIHERQARRASSLN